jgi:hypothetical protein
VTDHIPHANVRRGFCHWGESRAGSGTGNRITWDGPA